MDVYAVTLSAMALCSDGRPDIREGKPPAPPGTLMHAMECLYPSVSHIWLAVSTTYRKLPATTKSTKLHGVMGKVHLVTAGYGPLLEPRSTG